MAIAGGVITANSYASDLEPIGRHWFMDAEKSLDPLYPRLFDKMSTGKKYEHYSMFGGLGLASRVEEGASLPNDTAIEGPEKIFTQMMYGIQTSITYQAVKFGQAGIAMKNKGIEMRKALDEKKEELLADVLDNAFTSSYQGADQKELCATNHPLQDGSTLANELATSADLSESALEQMFIEHKDNMKDYRGKRVSIPVRFLIVPTEEVFNAERILKSVNRVATSDNDVNALASLGLLKEEIMHHHRLSDADAFFLKCDVGSGKGLILAQSEEATFKSDNDFDTLNMKFNAFEMYDYGWADHRVLFGSPGAT